MAEPGEESLSIHLPLPGGGMGNCADRRDVDLLDGVLRQNIPGYDGWAMGRGTVTFYLYGPEAEALWEAAKEYVHESSLSDNGGRVDVKYNPPGLHRLIPPRAHGTLPIEDRKHREPGE